MNCILVDLLNIEINRMRMSSCGRVLEENRVHENNIFCKAV